MANLIRLQKYIAECGIASRRAAEDLIRAGKVRVNGVVVRSKELGVKIDPETDVVEVHGNKIEQKEPKVYIKLNKPRGYVSSCKSERGERTVMDLITDISYRLYPIGRLDQASEGLMLLTNDGALANLLMHPRYEHEKEYSVEINERLTPRILKELASGVELEEGHTLSPKIFQKADKTFNIILREGKKRQIRRMVEAVGYKVTKLKRIRIGNIKLGSLGMGKYCYLSEAEVEGLY
ncbi:MAG: pseudouridine synthase [Candidatus Margulisiibacteriota bacterium]